MITTITLVRSTNPFSATRVIGYTESSTEAFKILSENTSSIYEYYDYAVLETVKSGVFTGAHRTGWYRNTGKQWVKCNKPRFARGISNWSMG